MRGCVVLGLVALSGCDLVFAPAKLSTDADSSHPDSELPPTDGTPDHPDGNPDVPDAMNPPPPDANTCGFECLGDFSAPGTAPCAGAPTVWCGSSALATLDPIDVCSCSTGEPSLFVFDVDTTGARMKVAYMPLVFQPYYLQVDGAGCFPPDVECSVAITCGGSPAAIVAYTGVAYTGSTQMFTLFADIDCSNVEIGSFQWNP